MALFLFFLGMNLLIPGVMLVCGIILKKKAPGKINGIVGYRTRLSMKNGDTWKFAHDYCGALWIKLGVCTLVVTILVSIGVHFLSNVVEAVTSVVLVSIQTGIIIASIFPVEKALKATFDEEGNRRELL